MKITRIGLLIIILITMLVSCDNTTDNSGNTKIGHIGFLVEPQCENQVRRFMEQINTIDSFKSGMLKINNQHSSTEIFNYYGYFESSVLNKEELEGYVNGAMRKCRANRHSEFDLSNPNVAHEFFELIKYENEKNPNDPMFITYKDGKLLVVYIGRD